MDITGIEYLCIDRILKRGTGDIAGAKENAILAYDHISEAYFLGCGDPEESLSLYTFCLDRSVSLLMVTDPDVGRVIFDRYGFSGKFECFQVAYYGDTPVYDPSLTLRTAERQDLPMLLENYHRLDPDEMEKVVERRSIVIGYLDKDPVGFIGEHLEGSIGLLYIFPRFRRKGYALELEKYYIAETIRKGYIPFGQVDISNSASLSLQKKIGMTKAETPCIWMWK